MNRPVDWAPLAGSDPVPGEPEMVERAGRHYRKVAVAINEAAAKLRRVAGAQDMQSDAVNAFRDSANKVAEDISRAHERYDAVGQALSGYAPQLRDAQDESVKALRQAKEAEATQATATQAAEAAQGRVDGAAKGADTTADQGDQRRAAGSAEAAGDALAAARKRLQGAVDARDTAAKRALGGINEVVKDADLNDGWWDNFGSKIVKAITWVADKVALVAGVLALAAIFIPVLAPLAAILGTIALVAGLVSLAGNVTLAASGDREWSAALWSIAGVLSFGVGKAAVAGLRGTVRGARYASQAARTTSRPYGGNRMARSVARGYRQQSTSHGLVPKPAAFGREVRGAFNPKSAPSDVRASESLATMRGMARAHPNDPELARHYRNAQIQEETVRLTNGYANFELLKSGYEQGKEMASPSPAEQLNLSKDGELAQPVGAGQPR